MTIRATASTLLLLLLAACASPTAMLDDEMLQCGPGQAIEIQAGLDLPRLQMRGNDDHLVLLVQVSNNSQDEVTVARIHVAQSSGETSGGYRIDPVTRQVDQAIAEARDHLFEIPLIGRYDRTTFTDQQRRGGEVVLRVTVTLESGDSYLCRFGIRAPA